MRTGSKAIVASVLVLAIMLSSVGGITYSWFSDTENIDIDVTTATFGVDYIVKKKIIAADDKGNIVEKYENYYSKSESPKNLDLTKGSNTEYLITVWNHSSIPIDLKIEVLSDRYQAITAVQNADGTYTYDTVAEVLPKDSSFPSKTGYKLTDSGWGGNFSNNALKNITFNELYQLSPFLENLDKTGGKIIDGTVEKKYDWVRHFTYRYTVCDLSIPAEEYGGSGSEGKGFSFPLKITVNDNFDGNLLKDLRLKIDYAQVKGAVQTIKDGTAKISINSEWPKDVCFTGEGFTVMVPKESLPISEETVVDTLKVQISKDGYLKVTLSYLDGNQTLTPNAGTVRIWFNYNIGTSEQPTMVSGYLSAPASDMEYILYTFPNGGEP